ncbi:MAG: ISL3 family transposase [Cyanobacteria bacterium P01_G01_bin.19]
MLKLTSTQTKVLCPICRQPSHRIHSRYTRRLDDLPIVEFKLTLLVQVCKFFCSNSDCHRRIFTERLPEIAVPWARKTKRLVEYLQSIALALGGQAGASLCTKLRVKCCGSTLLNQLHPLSLPTPKTPKILGVDDFALRKGKTYGTILVNLETNQPIGLLPDRKAETLTAWLEKHPGIEVLSRDRSKTYKSAMTKGAPEAVQVADRFHLVKNLGDSLNLALNSYRVELKAAEQRQYQDLIASLPEETVVVTSSATSTASLQQPIIEIHQWRIKQQQTIRRLRAQRWSQADIAQEVGLSIRTVQRYLAAPDFPGTPVSNLGKSILNPYKSQLLDWWNADIRQPSVLIKLLKTKGYQGSGRTVQRYLKELRQAQGLPPICFQTKPSLAKVIDPQTPPFTPRRAAYLITLRTENRQPEEEKLLDDLVQQHSDLKIMVELANTFLKLIRQRQANGFDEWLEKALGCSIKPLKTFAKGLLDDYKAVKASLKMAVSNGPVEGLNNKLKMLKRQMYGRAGLDLLAKRFILGV